MVEDEEGEGKVMAVFNYDRHQVCGLAVRCGWQPVLQQELQLPPAATIGEVLDSRGGVIDTAAVTVPSLVEPEEQGEIVIPYSGM